MRDQEILGLYEAYKKVHQVQEEVEQLDEISQKTATKAYAARATGEFENDTNPSDQTKSGKYKSDVARARIKKKFGDKAAKHADRAAHAQIFGRRSMPKVSKEEVELDEGKSSRPRYPGGRGVLDQERRDEKREASAENMRGHTAGPGTVTKNPKKLRKQKAMGEIGEQVDIYDIILSHLLDEGYAETVEAAEVIMVNMGEEWREEIMEGMTMKDFKANRRKLQRKEASDDAKKRGHVDKFTGKPYSTAEAESRRKDIHKPEKAPEREARRKFAEDPY